MPIAIIQARMGSTRLPEKILLDILGKPVLWRVVDRVSKAKFVKGVVVATTLNPEDDAVEKFCRDNNIPFFRGSLDDVLDRYYQCARKYDIGDIIRITADCPVHDPQVIDFVVGEYMRGGFDYVSNTIEYTFPDGLDVEVFSFNALEAAWKNAKLPSEREHVTPYIRESVEFKKKNVYSRRKYPLYRLTLDQIEDYEFIKRVYEGIGKGMFYLDDVIEFLEKNPDLLEINQHIGMNEGYVKSLRDDLKYIKGSVGGVRVDGGRIYLRELDTGDASEEYCKWLNDPEVNRFLETRKATVEELRGYIQEKKKRPDCLLFGIFLKDDDQHVGNIKLEPIDFVKKKATVGVLIGNRDHWGKGICTEAINLVVDYAFKNLHLERIDLGVISENKAAIGCYLKAGFKIDKVEKKAIKHDNRFYDKVIMSIVKVS